jgi:hypothetical protein
MYLNNKGSDVIDSSAIDAARLLNREEAHKHVSRSGWCTGREQARVTRIATTFFAGTSARVNTYLWVITLLNDANHCPG